MSAPAFPRKTPCATCPYRTAVPSGLWHRDEYEKLARYDGDISEQTATAIFMCHGADQSVCAGWLGHREPTDLLAVRLGLLRGDLDDSCASYETTVSLFDSGAAAAAHGMDNIDTPDEAAQVAIEKLLRARADR